jgi:hypothetical protein
VAIGVIREEKAIIRRLRERASVLDRTVIRERERERQERKERRTGRGERKRWENRERVDQVGG